MVISRYYFKRLEDWRKSNFDGLTAIVNAIYFKLASVNTSLPSSFVDDFSILLLFYCSNLSCYLLALGSPTKPLHCCSHRPHMYRHTIGTVFSRVPWSSNVSSVVVQETL